MSLWVAVPHNHPTATFVGRIRIVRNPAYLGVISGPGRLAMLLDDAHMLRTTRRTTPEFTGSRLNARRDQLGREDSEMRPTVRLGIDCPNGFLVTGQILLQHFRVMFGQPLQNVVAWDVPDRTLVAGTN